MCVDESSQWEEKGGRARDRGSIKPLVSESLAVLLPFQIAGATEFVFCLS